MTDLLASSAALLAIFLILVLVHGCGQYLAARWFGVRVERFSIGVGPVLWSRRLRNGAEFVIALLPLGCRVRMLDDRYMMVPAAQFGESMNRKKPWQRILITAAGPLANFLFAMVVLWLLILVSGVSQRAPYVVKVWKDSLASQSGLTAGVLITEVDGEPVHSAQDLFLAVAGRIGDSGVIRISGETSAATGSAGYVIPIRNWLRSTISINPLRILGVGLGMELGLPPVVGEVDPDSAAEHAGLREGDRILRVDGEELTGWDDFVSIVRASPKRSLKLNIRRDGEALAFHMTPDAATGLPGIIGLAGISAHQGRAFPGPLAAIPKVMEQTWTYSAATADYLAKLLTGRMSATNFAGPLLTIVFFAGDAAAVSWERYLFLLGFISIGLGIFNLLPFPILDGGRILFDLLELIFGRPAPEIWQARAVRVGVILVICLTVYVLILEVIKVAGVLLIFLFLVGLGEGLGELFKGMFNR